MPATQAVTYRILREVCAQLSVVLLRRGVQLASRVPELEPRTLLDFGSGTGSALWWVPTPDYYTGTYSRLVLLVFVSAECC